MACYSNVLPERPRPAAARSRNTTRMSYESPDHKSRDDRDEDGRSGDKSHETVPTTFRIRPARRAGISTDESTSMALPNSP